MLGIQDHKARQQDHGEGAVEKYMCGLRVYEVDFNTTSTGTHMTLQCFQDAYEAKYDWHTSKTQTMSLRLL